MTNSRRFLVACTAAGMLGASACAVYVRPPVPPPGAVFIVREPPPLRREAIVVRPGRTYIWVEGYWVWRQPEFVWVPGRWALPPTGARKWQPGRWHHEPRGWFWIEGYWK